MFWRRLGRFTAIILIAASSIVLAPSPAYAEDCEPEFREEPMPQRPWPLERLQPERILAPDPGRRRQGRGHRLRCR